MHYPWTRPIFPTHCSRPSIYFLKTVNLHSEHLKRIFKSHVWVLPLEFICVKQAFMCFHLKVGLHKWKYENTLRIQVCWPLMNSNLIWTSVWKLGPSQMSDAEPQEPHCISQASTALTASPSEKSDDCTSNLIHHSLSLGKMKQLLEQ